MNSKIWRRLALATGLVLALAACETTHYEFTAPKSDQGRFCVTQCAAVREACAGNEMQRAQSEKYTCERSNDVALRACLNKATNKDQEKDCERRRKHCWTGENMGRCEADYRQCFVNCGGAIRTYKQ